MTLPPKSPAADQVIRLARETLEIEAAAVLKLRAGIGQPFVHAVQLILQVQGRVVVMGMG